MLFGPTRKPKLPRQDDRKIRLLAERWLRAQSAQSAWATKAKECVDFMEGRQWTAAQLADLTEQGRPALVFNKIAPLVRLVLGYHRNNRTDVKYLPGHDGSGSQETSEALSQLWKQFSEASQVPYVDAEVFLDGILTGRGYYDMRMSFEENDFGEAKSSARDPFAIYVDPDADEYDLSKGCSYVMESRWASVDEIEYTYGKEASNLVGNLVKNDGYTQFPQTYYHTNDEITPIRKFGNEDSDNPEHWALFQDRWIDFLDPQKKNIRIIDAQHWVTKQKHVFIDLETGDKQTIPDHWDKQRVEKVMFQAERVGNPLTVDFRPVRRVRWSTLVGDLMVFDTWSPYDHFTINGFFPYFRRGQTRGMVEDLLDPQREKNKRRSAEIDIVGRTTNSGWTHHEGSLDPDQERNLDEFGSSPGVRIKWKGEAFMEPKRINPSPPPTSMERLEQKADEDMHQISGINESALGQLDRVQSGRAIEARQRQAVISVQTYMDNFSRTKELEAKRFLSLVQKHYTEHRIVRILGEDNRLMTTQVNQPVYDNSGNVVDRLRDVTLGKYSVVIDETPMSASFKSAQFEEAMELLEKIGPLVGPASMAFADLVVDMSSMPRKEEFKQRIQMAMGLQDSTAMASGTVAPSLALPPPSMSDGAVAA